MMQGSCLTVPCMHSPLEHPHPPQLERVHPRWDLWEVERTNATQDGVTANSQQGKWGMQAKHFCVPPTSRGPSLGLLPSPGLPGCDRDQILGCAMFIGNALAWHLLPITCHWMGGMSGRRSWCRPCPSHLAPIMLVTTDNGRPLPNLGNLGHFHSGKLATHNNIVVHGDEPW